MIIRLAICFGAAVCLFSYCSSIWTGLHNSHAHMLMTIHALGIIKREPVIELMKKFDRYDFLPHAPHHCWQNLPICINYSAEMPTTSYHGESLDAMYKFLKPGGKCLDIGSGTGYITACMAEMVGPTGKVYGIEHIPYIMEKSIEAIRYNHEHLIDEGRIEFLCRDGRAGLHEKGPFDVIHIGGSMVQNPYHLMSQLKPNGCLVAPIGLTYQVQNLRRFIKYNDTTFKIDDISKTIQEPLIPRIEQERQWNYTLSEANRTHYRMLEILKYKEYKDEKERKKAEEKLKNEKPKIPLTPLEKPPQGFGERSLNYINDLSAQILSNETISCTPTQRFDLANY